MGSESSALAELRSQTYLGGTLYTIQYTKTYVIRRRDAATGPSPSSPLPIIEDRRRELFVEGHRLGDIRRYALPLSPAAGTPYPGGGGVYGTQSCFPLPDVERVNNPNIAK